MTQNPLVSVIIPTYNRAHLIGETLDSVLAQTYQNWECIIVDDGSTDNTDEVVGAYVKKDQRFKYFHRPDEHLPGGNGARNYGFKMSQGEYVNWLDSDDLFSENKIEEQLKLIKGKSYAVSTCKWGRFEHKNDFKLKELYIFKNYKPAHLLLKDFGIKGNYFLSFCYLMTKDIILQCGLWNEHLKINQDGEFFCRVIINSKHIFFSKNSYGLYRFESNQNTSNFSDKVKAKHAIYSWQIIESYLNLLDENFDNYIKNAKSFLHMKLTRSYPELIRENKAFFKEQIKYYSLSKKLFRKIKKKAGKILKTK
ncbi:glycosyltransferase family 2 protein [Flavobacterium sp. CS20]|uniref:glycosyltransferase family 2 protein n=1 Tax=Flavobacterium sp. CS20 TaxID=2775246 RepID=UPI001B3A0D84|nr:glycosyltransferase family 2 protein [Flavobacterium sp. CS20]QTY28145.1 glycosyltransferase family 2 protein [Flavobacterium sp. CS20]